MMSEGSRDSQSPPHSACAGERLDLPALLICQDEALRFVNSIQDRTTFQLMAVANTTVAIAIGVNKIFPIAPFDMLFFNQVMLALCSKHELIKETLLDHPR